MDPRPALDRLHVAGAMARGVVRVHPEDDIQAAELLMVGTQVRRVPVVDRDDRPVGIVTITDFAREAARSGPHLQQGLWRAVQVLVAIAQARHHRAA